jgi:tRNA-splicing ligase RtcB
MKLQHYDTVPVWGDVQVNALEQMQNCMKHPSVHGGALMADHHLGYAVPVGGVIAYRDAISPSGVGFDIACGNKAVLTDLVFSNVDMRMEDIMNKVFSAVSFGVGQKNNKTVDHKLFSDPAWDIPAIKEHKQMARLQLGTVGSGNHYVDIFVDELERIWVGVHFGSRGLGHKLASYYIKMGGGKDGINVDPVVLDVNSDLGAEYLVAMELAGRYAYAGRDWVCDTVVKILGGKIIEEVHNHHNFAWKEHHSGEDIWVIRKGATPAFPGQKGFVGGTMGENSVILEGVEHEYCKDAYYSTVHGAGRTMSRTEAAGKSKWVGGTKVKVSDGVVTPKMMDKWVKKSGIVLRGAGLDESPDCYKRLDQVLDHQGPTIKVLHTLKPLGVAMAPSHTFDPYRD